MNAVVMDVLLNTVRIAGINSPDLPVEALSGGQRQAVAIARAVHFKTEMLILDEPTSALSVRETEKVLAHVGGLKHDGVSAVLITHNLHHAWEVCDRFVVLAHGKVVMRVPRAETSVRELSDVIVIIEPRQGRGLYSQARAPHDAASAHAGPEKHGAGEEYRDGGVPLRSAGAERALGRGALEPARAGALLARPDASRTAPLRPGHRRRHPLRHGAARAARRAHPAASPADSCWRPRTASPSSTPHSPGARPSSIRRARRARLLQRRQMRPVGPAVGRHDGPAGNRSDRRALPLRAGRGGDPDRLRLHRLQRAILQPGRAHHVPH